MTKKLRQGTLCVQAGYKAKNGEPIELPIIQSTTFKYDDSDEMAKLFDLEKEGYFYTRLQNPTNDAVAAKICTLEGGVGAVLTSSGQAANFYAVFNICEAGDHIVTSNEIYGGTFNLFGVTLKKLGQKLPLFYCFPPTVMDLYGVKIGLHHIRYDSIDPVFLTIEDDGKIGIVIDGKLDKESAKKLMDCRRIVLCNEAKLHDAMPSALRRRVLSVYNTSEEQKELFKNYKGEIIKR